MAQINSVFFDLDGTLTDPKPGITGSIQYALEKLGHAVPSVDDLEWCIGPPLLASFETLVGEADAVAALTHYRERFAATGLYENSVYPDIPRLLENLRGQGLKLYLATSKPRVFAQQILNHFELSGFLQDVFGSELDGTRVDKSELLAHALAWSGADPNLCIMVGDRSHDMIGARSNKMRAVGVLYGFGSRAELEYAGADHLIAEPSGLMDYLAR